MEFSVAQTYLSDVLHAVSQALLAPDIILLLAFMGYALFSIGSVIAEYFTERKHFTVVMPKFLAALMAADEADIPLVIEESGLLKRQKEALNTVYEYRNLPGDALIALVRRLVSEEETRYDRITGRNNMAAKVSPMLGLMGTLIPLGPGIQALGKADTAALSSSLLVAFDTTVAGLVTAAVCLVVGKIRSNWYNNYLSALDAAMATMLEKIESERGGNGASAQQKLDDYSFLFDRDLGKNSKKSNENSEKEHVQAPIASNSASAPAADPVPAPVASAAPAANPVPAASSAPAPNSASTPVIDPLADDSLFG